jgi:hypothetical protein
MKKKGEWRKEDSAQGEDGDWEENKKSGWYCANPCRVIEVWSGIIVRSTSEK